MSGSWGAGRSSKSSVARSDPPRLPLAVLGAREAFGEMAVLDTTPRSATVEALEDTEFLAVGSEEFYKVLREQGELAEAVIKMLSARLRKANEAAEGRHSIEVA
jgi:CRP-like cAMP-binding protein